MTSAAQQNGVVKTKAPLTPLALPTNSNLEDEIAIRFQKDGLGYRLVASDARISIDYIKISSEDVKGWVSVSITGDDVAGDGLLIEQWFNIGSANTQDKLVKSLKEHCQSRPWSSYVQTFCSSVMASIREGEPWEMVGRMTTQARSRDLVEGVISAHEVSSVFAPGGSGKGHMAISIGLSVAMGAKWNGREVSLKPRVILADHVYKPSRGGCAVVGCDKLPKNHQRDPRFPGVVWILDWEDYSRTADERIKAHMRGTGIVEPDDFPQLSYRHCMAPIKTYIHQLVRKAEDEEPDLIIVDSVGQAMGTAGEHGTYEDLANDFFALLRKLSPATILLIDHVKGDGVTENKLTGKAFGCHSADTEVLTPGGWKTHDKWTPGESILVYNPDQNIYHWQVPQKLWEYDYQGDMRRVSLEGADALVTPNHRMLVRPANFHIPKGNGTLGRPITKHIWKDIEAKDLKPAGYWFPWSGIMADETPDQDTFEIAGYKLPAKPFLDVLGWWISEGSHSRNAAVFAQAEGPLAGRMRNSLDELGISWSVCEHTPTGDRAHEQPMCYFRLKEGRGTPLANWLGEHCGKGAQNKRLPTMAFGLSVTQKQVLIESLVDGDGSRKPNGYREYFTSSKQLATDVQRLTIQSGQHAWIGEPKKSPKSIHQPYCVHISPVSRTVMQLNTQQPGSWSTEDYNDKVYCFTVQSDAYLTRRNGRLFTSRNSIYKQNNIHGMAWEMMRDQENGDSTSIVAWFNVKNNNGVLQPPLAMKLVFGGEVMGVDDWVTMTEVNITDYPMLSQFLPPYPRVAAMLYKLGRSYASHISDELQKEAKATGTKPPFKDEEALTNALVRWAEAGKIGRLPEPDMRFYPLASEELNVRRERRKLMASLGQVTPIRLQEEDQPVYQNF